MFQLLAILSFWICTISANLLSSRIIQGEPINIEDAPHQISLIRTSTEKHICGGSIVSKNYILTAAHCAGSQANEYKVRVGSSFWGHDGQLHDVIEVIKHENYGANEFGIPINDVALMRVKPELQIDGKTKKIIELFGKMDVSKTGTPAVVTGWGKTENGTLSDQLRSLKISIVSKMKCNEAYAESGGLPDGQICAAHSTGLKDMCNGDSGGPLIVYGKQAGIVSWSGPGCALPQYPGVYTEVAVFRDWIEKHIDL